MPTNPKLRGRSTSSSLPNARKRKLKGPIRVQSDKATPAATAEDEPATEEQSSDEQITAEQTADEQAADEQAADDQITGDQAADEETTDEEIMDEQITDEQTADDQIADEQITEGVSDDGIKDQAATDEMEANTSITDTPAINIATDYSHGSVPSRRAKYFAWSLLLLAPIALFVKLPAFVSSAVRHLKAFFLELELTNAISRFMRSLGYLCVNARLLYAIYQDLMALLIVLRPVPNLLKAYRYLLALLEAMLQDLLTLLEPIHPILTLPNAVYRRLQSSLSAFYRHLPARLRHCSHLALQPLRYLHQGLLAGLRLYSRVWKWVLIACVIWLSGTYTITFTLHHNPGLLSETICPIPIAARHLPLCQPLPLEDIWHSKLLVPQDEFATIMGRLGKDHDLARELIGHRSAVRDLGIRVMGSALENKNKIAEALESLKEQTWTTGRSLSSFTSKFTGIVDTLHGFDKYALRLIERRISDGPDGPNTFMSFVLAALYPLTGIRAHRPIGDDIKEVFRSTAGFMAKEINALVNDVDKLARELDDIQRFLTTVKSNVEGDIRLLPSRDILGLLWDRLAPRDDHASLYASQDPRTLLMDLTHLYEAASMVVDDTLEALLRVRVELEDFEVERIQSSPLLKQYPLEVMASSLRSSMKKLEAGKQALKTGGSGTRFADPVGTNKNTRS
ncbi:uncharacterized protein B0H64DRAFT_376994 [Chaetomium fimeti]|uniref:Uncharacterized protein n=1 Tax=Chaetomium fimeti TaxID=1854472 RepID=A0AAE0H9Q0_9PEZI|nr:hypothetical protein B0H64DRAFT_376994 [Chaetomium fimeti]